jgi:hypothetical protein
MTYLTCHRCGDQLGSQYTFDRHQRNGCVQPRSVDAADIVARLEGIPSVKAGRMCGVDGSTVRRWRRTGRISPDMHRQVMQVLGGSDEPTSRGRGRPRQTVFVDVHCTWTSDGWIVDAYRHGLNDPIDTLAFAAHAGQRWPTLHDAHRFARRRFGDALMSLTPEAHDEEATA